VRVYETTELITTDVGTCGATEIAMPSVAVKVAAPVGNVKVSDRLSVSVDGASAALVTSIEDVPSGETVRVSIPAALGALVQVAGVAGTGWGIRGLPMASSTV
jgi:hypothetical protein